MKVVVTKECVSITECHIVTEGEYCVNECEFYLPECFDGLTVTAVFNNIPVPLFNNRCFIPSLKKGGAVLGVYAYRKDGEKLELVYSPKPTAFFVEEGSYTDRAEPENIPEISKYEEYCTMLSQLCENLISQIDYIEKSNLTKQISAQSTHSQVASAKAVYDSKQDIIKTVNNDIAEIKEKHNNFMGSVSNALVGKKEGNCLVVEDVSPLSHKISCKLKGVNLASVSTTGDFVQRKQITFNKTFPADVYSFSAIVESTDTDSSMCLFSFTLNGSLKKTIMIERSVDSQRVALENISVSSEFDGICFYASISNVASAGDSAKISDIQLEKGCVATDYVPYFDYKDSNVTVGGKNLCPITDVECNPNSENQTSSRNIMLDYTLPEGVYSLSAVVESNDTDKEECMVAFQYVDEDVPPRTVGYCMMTRSKNGERVKVESIRLVEPFNRIWFYPSASSSDSVGDTASFKDFQLEFGSLATDFENYKMMKTSVGDKEGYIHSFLSNYPVTSVFTINKGATVEVDYNRDINKVITALENAIIT